MIDKRVSVSVSVPCTCAWAAWAVVLALLGMALLAHEILWGIFALATSAVAATLHMRCFMMELNGNIHDAFELGRESERATPLRVLR